MATIGGKASYFTGTNATSHTSPITLGSGAVRKVDLQVLIEGSTFTPTTVTVNGQNAVAYGTSPEINPNDTLLRSYSYYYDVPSGVPAGNITIAVTSSTSTTTLSWHAVEVIGAASGAPEAVAYGHSSAAGGNSTASLTATGNAALTAAAICHAATQTLTFSGSVVEDNETDPPNHTTAGASASAVAAGTRSATVIPSGGGRTSIVLASYADAGGGGGGVGGSNAPRSMFYTLQGMR